MRSFDTHYSRGLFYGLIALLWFAVFNKAAYDLWAATIIFSATTVFVLIFIAGRLRDHRAIQLPLLAGFAVLLLAFGLSQWHSYDLESSWIEFWGWAFAILLFYLFVNVVDTPAERDRFFSIAGLALIPLAVLSLGQKFGNPTPGNWDAPATLVNAMVLAGFILYWPLFYWQKTLENSRYALLLIACLMMLIFIQQRAAMGIVVSAFALNLVRVRSQSMARERKMAVVAFALAAAGLAITFQVKSQLQPVGINPAASYNLLGRLYYWQTALAMWRHQPWLGVGLGGFGTAYPYFKLTGIENTRFVHCFPLQVLAETGVIGMTALGFLSAKILGLRRKTAQVTGSEVGALSIFDLTLFGILGFSLVSISLDFLLNKIMLLFFLGAALTPFPGRGVRIPTLWLGCAGFCIALITPFWLNLLLASQLYTSGLEIQRQGDLLHATRLYKEAIVLEPFHALSYWELAKIYAQQYQQNHNPADLAASQTCLQQAIRYKKDIQFFPKAVRP